MVVVYRIPRLGWVKAILIPDHLPGMLEKKRHISNLLAHLFVLKGMHVRIVYLGLACILVNTHISLYIYMTQIRDDSIFTSNGVLKKMKYIDQHLVAFEARDLILSFSNNSAIIIFRKIW